MERNKEKQPFTIRSCQEQDLEKIRKIEQKSFPTPWPKASFRHILQRNSGIFFVAVNSSDISGYSVANVERDVNLSRFQTRREGHLLKIAVSKEERREGIGTTLMRMLEENLQDKGVENVKLEVRVQNNGARDFYQKIGFEEKELIKNYYPDGAHAIVMRKRIS